MRKQKTQIQKTTYYLQQYMSLYKKKHYICVMQLKFVYVA